MLRAASPPRVHEVSAPPGPRVPRRDPPPPGDGQLWHAQASSSPGLAEAPLISHFVPTSSSWLNLVERWFGELTSRRIRRGSFRRVEDLEKAIAEFLAAWNESPKPFVWTATVQSIVEKLSRCRQTLEQIRPGCCTLPRRRKAKR